MNKNHIDTFRNSSEQDCRATDSWYNRDYTDINGEPKVKTFEKEFQPKIAHYFNKEVSVLDAGSGNGRFTYFFSNHAGDVTACDPYQPLHSSFIKENIEYYQTKFLDFDLPNHRNGKKYDIIFMNGLLYLYSMKDIHAPPGKKIHSSEKLDIAFEKTKSLLADNGVLIVVGCNDRVSTLDLPEGGHYNLHKQAQKFNFELVDIYRFLQYNTHMSVLKNLG